MAHVAYTEGKRAMLNGEISWTSDDIRALLVKSTYTPNADTDVYVDDITGASKELVATGYARQTVTSKTLTPATGIVEISSANVAFGALGGATNDTIGGIVFYKHNASDGAATLLYYIDTTPDPTTNGGTVTFTIATYIASL